MALVTGPSVIAALENARASLGALSEHLDDVGQEVGGLVQTSASTTDLNTTGPEGLSAAVERAARDLDDMRSALETLGNRARSFGRRQVQRARYTDSWWVPLRDELVTADSGEKWLTHFTSGLVAGEWEFCGRMLEELPALAERNGIGVQSPWLEPGPGDGVPEGIQSVLEQSVAALTFQRLEPTAATAVRVLHARVRLATGDTSGAREVLEQLHRGEQASPAVLSGLGDLHIVEDDPEAARDLYTEALELDPTFADARLGMGRWCEEESRWAESDEWYTSGLESLLEDPTVANLEHAVRAHATGATGNLFLQVSRCLEPEDVEVALAAVDLALARGVHGDGEAALGRARTLRGDLLLKLGREADAADEFVLGAIAIVDGDQTTALDLLERAHRLTPGRLDVSWWKGEALRQRSYVPEPPYVDEASAIASLAAFDSGLSQGLPDDEHSWIYTARALACEQRANVAGTDEYRWRWEAATFLERAAIHRAWDSYVWTYMTRIHRTLRNLGTAILAAERASEISQMQAAQEEYAAALADAGRLDDALEVIENVRSQETSSPSPWLDAVHSWVLYLSARPERSDAALELVDKAIDAEPGNIWFHYIRGAVVRVRGQFEECTKEAEWLRDQLAPTLDDVRMFHYLGYYARACYWLGELDESWNALERLRDQPDDGRFALLLQGLIELRRRRLPEADVLLRKAIDSVQANYDMSLAEWTELDVVTSQLDGEQVSDPQLSADLVQRARGMAAGMRDLLRERLRTAAGPDALAEMEAALEAGSDNEEGRWRTVCALAARARLLLDDGRPEEAVDAYVHLADATDGFSGNDARLGLGAALKAAWHAALARGDLERTQVLVGQLVQLNPAHGARATLALVGALASAGETESARKHLAAVVEMRAEVWTDDAGLGDLVTLAVPTAADYAALDGVIRAVQTDEESDKSLREGVSVLKERLDRRLDELLGLPAPEIVPLPLVTPIIVEVGEDLVPLVDPEQSGAPFMDELLPRMKERVFVTTGVRLPGVLLRPNTNLPANGFSFLLDEVPQTGGTVSLDVPYVVRATEPGSRRPASSVTRFHPLTGDAGSWEVAPWLDGVDQNVVRLSASEYLVHAIESLVRVHLGRFLGPQEVVSLIDEWREADADLVSGVIPDDEALLALSWVLQSAVEQTLSIAAWRSVLESIRAAGGLTASLPSVQAAVGQSLRRRTASATAEPRVVVPDDLEQGLLELSKPGGGLAAHKLLGWLRSTVEEVGPVLTLVTSEELRTVVSALARAQHEQVITVSEADLP